MATTKIWSIRDSLSRVVDYAENPEKTENPNYSDTEIQGLYDVMNYAADEHKTEMQYYVSSVNCVPEIACEQMIMTKRQFNKEGGIVAFHAYQSFKPGEITPDKAHQIGIELATRLWGGRFQVVVATHLNTNCVHNHFVLNSVSFLDGKRYNDCKKSYKAFREMSDQVCCECGLSVIENPSPTRTPRSIYFAEKAGRPTLYNIMREDIDSAIRQSMTRKQFGVVLRVMGYKLNFDPRCKYATIKMPDAPHPTRLKTLGDNYTEEAIDRRILENQCAQRPIAHTQPKIKWYRFVGNYSSAQKITGLRALYLHYCYLLGVIPKSKPRREPLHPRLKAELIKLRQYSEQIRLLSKHKIDTAEQLQDFISATEEKSRSLISERTGVYNKLRRCTDPEQIRELKSARGELSGQIAQCRNELKSANGVLGNMGKVKENIKLEREMRATQKVKSKVKSYTHMHKL